eukprot:15340432-Ditylum_brightwellii.AAC.2
MIRTRNLAGELDETATDEERGLMLMDALCNLNLDDEDTDTDDDKMKLSIENKANEEMSLEENFLISEEGDIALGITDNKKSEHPTST